MLDFLSGYFRYKTPGSKHPLSNTDRDDSLASAILSLTSPLEMGQLRADRVAAIIADADEGDPRGQAELFSIVQEKEPIWAAHLQTRRLAVLGCPMRIESKKHAREAEEIMLLLERAKWRGAMSTLLDAIGTGYAGVVVDWLPGGAGINGFSPIMPTAWVFDAAGNPAIAGVSGSPVPMTAYHPAQILYLVSEGKVGLPCRKGVMRTLLWMFLFKNGGFRNWTTFLERFGVPFILGKISANDFKDPVRRDELKKALMAIRGGGVGIGTTETDMQILNGAAAGNKDAFEQFQRYCDEIVTLVLLGQLASSDKAGGLSRGTAQDKVRQDILEADCQMVQECFQALIGWVCQFKYGMPDADDIKFVIDFHPPEDLKATAEMFATVANAARRPLDPKQVFERFGVKLGEPEPVPEVAPAGAPEQKEFTDTAGRKTETASEKIINATLSRLVDTEALEAWRIPVDAAIRQAFGDLNPDDPELLAKFRKRAPAFLASLPGLMDEFETAAFEDALQGAMLAGFLNGTLPASFWKPAGTAK